MKIAILGYSGSGKSTLARKLGDQYQIPVLHLDSLHFLADWVEQEPEDGGALLGEFMDNHEHWIIEGAYSHMHYERRLEEADQIYLLTANRWIRLKRCLQRTAKYYGKTRPDMAEGCSEKFDLEFIKWVLWDGCRPARRREYKRIAKQYSIKTTVIPARKYSFCALLHKKCRRNHVIATAIR